MIPSYHCDIGSNQPNNICTSRQILMKLGRNAYTQRSCRQWRIANMISRFTQAYVKAWFCVMCGNNFEISFSKSLAERKHGSTNRTKFICSVSFYMMVITDGPLEERLGRLSVVTEHR